MADAEPPKPEKTRAKRLQRRFPTVDDLRARARWRVPRFAFDFVDGGANEETCAARAMYSSAPGHISPGEPIGEIPIGAA